MNRLTALCIALALTVGCTAGPDHATIAAPGFELTDIDVARTDASRACLP